MEKCQVVFLTARRQKNKAESATPGLTAAATDGVIVLPRERRQATVYDFKRPAAAGPAATPGPRGHN
jgi:hypothetical protein